MAFIRSFEFKNTFKKSLNLNTNTEIDVSFRFKHLFMHKMLFGLVIDVGKLMKLNQALLGLTLKLWGMHEREIGVTEK